MDKKNIWALASIISKVFIEIFQFISSPLNSLFENLSKDGFKYLSHLIVTD